MAVQRCLIGRYGRSLYVPALGRVAGVKAAGAGENMKIYLLMVLIGTLLAMVRFTSVPEHQSKTLPNS
jgi:hypothetical protein